MTASSTLFLDPFDCDVVLRDAALDEANRPTRRMIANASLAMHLEDAYYSVRELREAVIWVHEGAAGGKRKLTSLLSNPDGDDFQRCIYFCLAGRGVVEMIEDLLWLEHLLEARGRVGGCHVPWAAPAARARVTLCRGCARRPGRGGGRRLPSGAVVVGRLGSWPPP